MKQFTKYPKAIKASYSYEPKFQGNWSDEDIALWKSIDWKARDYKEFPVEDDTFEGEITIYGEGPKYTIPVTFQKMIRPNPIFGPYYAPAFSREKEKEMLHKYAGPMSDGNKHNGYMVADRYETYRLYDQLSR